MKWSFVSLVYFLCCLSVVIRITDISWLKVWIWCTHWLIHVYKQFWFMLSNISDSLYEFKLIQGMHDVLHILCYIVKWIVASYIYITDLHNTTCSIHIISLRVTCSPTLVSSWGAMQFLVLKQLFIFHEVYVTELNQKTDIAATSNC